MISHLFLQGHLADATFLKHLLYDGTVKPLNPILNTAYIIGYRPMLYGTYSVLVPSSKASASRDVCEGFVVDMNDAQMLCLYEKEARGMNLALVDCDVNIPQGRSQTGPIVDRIAGQVLVWAGDREEMRLREGKFDLLHWEDVVKPARMAEERE